MRSTETQTWPPFAYDPSAAWPAAHSGSTPSSTISGSLPPFSSSTFAPVPTAASAIARPAANEPTGAMTSRPSWAHSRAPVSPPPSSTVRTPSGRNDARRSPTRRPRCGHRSLGLCTTVLPVTSAAPMRPAATATGPFHGVIAATTPRGPGTMRSVADQEPCSDRPRCSGPSSAYCSRVPAAASTPPSLSSYGRPVSVSLRRARSSACARRAEAASRTRPARCAGSVRAQSGPAATARPTASSTSSGPAGRTRPTTSSVAGSRISISAVAVVMAGRFPPPAVVTRAVRRVGPRTPGLRRRGSDAGSGQEQQDHERAEVERGVRDEARPDRAGALVEHGVEDGQDEDGEEHDVEPVRDREDQAGHDRRDDRPVAAHGPVAHASEEQLLPQRHDEAAEQHHPERGRDPGELGQRLLRVTVVTGDRDVHDDEHPREQPHPDAQP